MLGSDVHSKFHGKYYYKLDSAHRLRIPPMFKDILGTAIYFAPTSDEKGVKVYPAPVAESYLSEFVRDAGLNKYVEEDNELIEDFYSMFLPSMLDAQCRLRIPDEYYGFLGLEGEDNDVITFGMGDYFIIRSKRADDERRGKRSFKDLEKEFAARAAANKQNV